MHFILMIFGIFVGLMSSNWLVVIFSMEWSMFCLIFLVANYSYLNLSSCVIKYFFTQSIGSVLLFASGLLVSYNMEFGSVFNWGAIMGFGLKLGVFPFHFWVIPVNSVMPYFPLSLINSPLKILPLALLQSLYLTSSEEMFLILLVVLAAGSLGAGAMLGQGCISMRAMLGASSITHSGWLLLAILCWDTFKYLAAYSVSLILLILALLNKSSFPTWICLYALSGLPPFSVFLGKLYVIQGAIACQLPYYILIIALTSSVFSLLFYLKFTFQLYMLSANYNDHLFFFIMFFGLNSMSVFFSLF